MKHRIVTAAQMKAIEQAGNAHGLPYLQMMENAGLAAYAELKNVLPQPGSLLVVCGKGNNGGDGFVIARAAAKEGWNVTAPLAEGEPKTTDAITNFERLSFLTKTTAMMHTTNSVTGKVIQIPVRCNMTASSGCSRKAGESSSDWKRTVTSALPFTTSTMVLAISEACRAPALRRWSSLSRRSTTPMLLSRRSRWTL